MSIYTAKLSQTPEETWGNTILWRLLFARGVIKEGDLAHEIDPDVALAALEDDMKFLKEFGK